MVPRKIAFRAWAACLGSQARRLRRLASDEAAEHAERTRGPGARAGSDHKAIGRHEMADRLLRDAGVISGWIDDPAHRGGDVDPVLFSLVVCYLYRHGDALPALRRWVDHRDPAGRIDHADPADVPGFIERLLEIPPGVARG
jgi:hypothetical protein